MTSLAPTARACVRSTPVGPVIGFQSQAMSPQRCFDSIFKRIHGYEVADYNSHKETWGIDP